MSFPLYKAAISIGVYVRRKSKYHSSPSHTKHSKTGTKKPPEYSTIITKKNTSLKIKYSLSVKDNKAMITAVGNPI